MALDDALADYTVPDDLAERIDALDLRGNVADLVDDGYTIIQDPVAHALTDAVRAAILRLAQESDGPIKGHSAALLLGRDPVFEQAVTTPKLLTLVEYLLGRGALLSQLIGSVRRKGPHTLGLHADNSWFPAPFPPWEIMCTACWVTDVFTEEAGSTLVIPGSHKHKTHPPRDVRKALDGAISIEAPKGSLVLWDGSVWHGNYPRQIDGERVVLHLTYTRVGMAPVEDYRHLDDAWLADKDPTLARLLGRQNFLGSTTATSGGVIGSLLRETYRQVHGDGGY
jgi:Phytanoyl-CoA dioxygenase (PhyH)